MPGILQSPFMNKIGGSDRVRDELTAAFAEGRGVTAKVRWVSGKGGGDDDDGRSRWIHCTPLIGGNGSIGVWMIVIVDDEQEKGERRWRQAPPVPPTVSRSQTPARDRMGRWTSRTGYDLQYGRRTGSQLRNGYLNGLSGQHSGDDSFTMGSNRSTSPTSLRIG